MISDIYLDNTLLNGAAVNKENINVYKTVQENNSLCAYPTFENPSTCSISIRLRMITIIGAIVATALYANPTIFVVNVFFSNILLSFTPIPAIYDPFLIHFVVLSRSLSFYL